MSKLLIDVHHHARPLEYNEALAAVGLTTFAGRPPGQWARERALDLMERNGVGTTILSSPDSESAFAHEALGISMSRRINEMYAGLIASDGKRFGGFASLPLPHVDAALRELAFSLDELQLDGVFLGTNHAGIYLGDPRFDPVFQELDRRGAVVFVHPASPRTTKPEGLNLPGWLIDFSADTTRCIANLIAADIPARFPNIRFIMSHAGGFAPYMLFRLATYEILDAVPGNVPTVEFAMNKVETALKSFYYDTTQSAHPTTLKLLLDLVGAEKIVFGTDHPQVTDSLYEASVAGVRAFTNDNPGSDGCIRENALRLFPRLAGS